MSGVSTELKVGAFAMAVLSVLAFMTFKVGGLEWTKTKGYTLYVSFNNTAGLDEKTRVKVAGVDAGVIQGIELYKGRARVKLEIDPGIRIYRDASASIKSTGLLGDKFLAIKIGSPDQPVMKDGDSIENISETIEIEELARNLINVSKHFSTLAENLNEVLGTEEAKNSLSSTIENLSEVTASLNRTINANDHRLRNVLDNINALTVSINTLIDSNRDHLTSTISNMKDFSGTLKTSGPELVENLNKATQELRSMVEENRPRVKNTIESMDTITTRINNGEGSLGKLMKDDRLYESLNKAADGVNKTLSAVDRFKTFITFQADYLTKPKDAKGYFSVTLQPQPDKYYILGVVGDPVGSVTTKETTTTPPGVTVKQEVAKEKLQFTAQFAKRFGDAAVRIGMTENTFGAGADYFFNNDKGKVSADIWDIGSDEEDAKNPHVKIGMEYFVFRNIFFSGGADNIMNRKWRGGYVGGGLRFEDEDFKYLLGTLPKISTQ